MPKIIKDEAQEQALKDIETMLAVTSDLNTRIRDRETNYTVQLVSGKKPVMTELDSTLCDKVRAIVIAQKKIYVKEIRTLAKTYRIELSDEEEQLLADDAV